ncbi:MAG: hypothetical protein HHJ17_17775 [Rhodoferax sp.]|uniref:hypothetical protein n=1 Tax=Rhodoferax sp. TaxID=50421 RepID=UPI0017F2FBF8|nr:hypothetical protein [Rhodoferax sp.]NMM15370.1 hypothetical protein [Rhodoferax sp.]
MKPLPKDLKSTCARIALERGRSAQRATTAELRKQAQAMLASGQPAMLVQAQLDAMLGDALRAQAKH